MVNYNVTGYYSYGATTSTDTTAPAYTSSDSTYPNVVYWRKPVQRPWYEYPLNPLNPWREAEGDNEYWEYIPTPHIPEVPVPKPIVEPVVEHPNEERLKPVPRKEKTVPKRIKDPKNDRIRRVIEDIGKGV